MLNGILTLWFILTVLSLVYVIYDLVKVTPEAGVMKAAWILVTIYTGPIGLFLYLLTCKEPIPGTHEKFIDQPWKQALGSEVHCLAGDATGIIVAAIILSFFEIPRTWEIIIEYIAGFGFGLFIFQALFMRKMMGGTYSKAVTSTFFPEWLSMNMIMAGMIPVMVIWSTHDTFARDPWSFHFWGMMSLATIIGGVLAYPMNFWLVSNKLKHGMTTVRAEHAEMKHEHAEMDHKHHAMPKVNVKRVYNALWISLITLAVGIIIAIIGCYV